MMDQSRLTLRPLSLSNQDNSAASTEAPKGLLFTAFEPSGDDHAAVVIMELRKRYSAEELPIYAWGGPKMEAAGATIVEHTGDDAVMGLPGFKKIMEHRRINGRVAKWLDVKGRRGVVAHIPVDSPAANFPICRITKRRGLKVIHLVAPQIWAWASWRIKKLRRLTDMVLCLLPFEEAWFVERGVPAKFIGHPLFDKPLDISAIDDRVARFPASLTGTPKLAIMPGSRPSEMGACFPILLDAFRRLRADFPQTCAVVAATRPEVAERLREIAIETGGWPEDVHVVSGDTDAVIRWCDYALVVSGTVTLQIAKQRKPMVAVYQPNKFVFKLIGQWLVSTQVFTLPNLIASAGTGGRTIIPEFIPHFGDGEPLAVEVIKFMRRTGYTDDQRRELDAVCRRFEDGPRAGAAAADAIEEVLGF